MIFDGLDFKHNNVFCKISQFRAPGWKNSDPRDPFYNVGNKKLVEGSEYTVKEIDRDAMRKLLTSEL